MHKIEPGTYSLVILDAWYRAIPAGVSENDNAPIALLYNVVDQISAGLDCSWVNIHHASKGQQGDKAVTDVGAGAGSQSRAADTHIVLREHEDDAVVVLDAVVRSFAPVEPLALRWDFPCWHPADELDATKLKGLKSPREQKQSANDAAGFDKIKKALRAPDEQPTQTYICRKTGLSADRSKRLLNLLESDEIITSSPTTKKGNECRLYHLTQGVSDE